MERPSDQMQVAAARADFLRGDKAGLSDVTDVVAASWRRSATNGVDATALDPQYHEGLDMSSRLVRCADPVLNRLMEETSDLALVVALCDSRARILARRDTSPDIARLFDRIHLAPGFEYSETGIGTNGVGTVLESGRSISVVGAEHFHERLQTYACTGAPIVDPATGRVEGVLDISSLSQRWSPLMHSLVRSAAWDIGRNLLADRNPEQQALFDSYVRLNARTHHAVLAVSGSVEMVNSFASTHFSPTERQALIDEAKYISKSHERFSTVTVLSTGKRVHLQCTRIDAGATGTGVVAVATVVGDETGSAPDPSCADSEPSAPTTPAVAPVGRVSPTGRTTGAMDLHGSKSWVWRKPLAQLDAALRRNDSVLVMGETGSGKFTSVLALFHELHPGGRSLSFDASTFDSDNFDHVDAQAIIGSESALLVLRNIDELSTRGVSAAERLLESLERSSQHVHIGATLSDAPLERELPFRQLLPYFTTSVSLPGIRFRTEDIPFMTEALLRELAPERDTRVDPRALAVLARYSWPRNIVQLREALQHALERRPVGTITADDLPGYCFSEARHGLTRVERSERDTIIETLQELDGNRAKAAAQLGISRSTLYRKISRYGITSV